MNPLLQALVELDQRYGAQVGYDTCIYIPKDGIQGFHDALVSSGACLEGWNGDKGDRRISLPASLYGTPILEFELLPQGIGLVVAKAGVFHQALTHLDWRTGRLIAMDLPRVSGLPYYPLPPFPTRF